MISYKIHKNFIILSTNASKVDEAFINKLNNLYKKYEQHKKVLDITNITDFDYKFINFIYKNNIMLINKNSDNFLSLFLTNSDKYIKIYNTELDLINNNIIIKRRLKLCG